MQQAFEQVATSFLTVSWGSREMLLGKRSCNCHLPRWLEVAQACVRFMSFTNESCILMLVILRLYTSSEKLVFIAIL